MRREPRLSATSTPPKPSLRLPWVWGFLAWGTCGVLLAWIIPRTVIEPHSGWILAGVWLTSGLLVAAIGAFVLHRRPPIDNEQDRRWQDAFQANRQGVWEYDAKDDRLYHAPQWKASLGYGDEEAGNRLQDWMERIHPEDLGRVVAAMQRHIDGEVAHYESLHRIRQKDGSHRWFLDRGEIIQRDAQGQPLRIIGTKIEASQRQLSQEVLDQLAANVPGMLYQYRIDPDGSAHFPYVSEGVRELYGLSPDQLRAEPSLAYTFIHPDDRQARQDETIDAIRTLSTWHAEYRIVVPDRGERWVSGYARPQRMDDGATLWHGYVVDITADKLRALKLQETERLLRRLMKDMPIGLCLVDATGAIYFRNHGFERLFNTESTAPATLGDLLRQSLSDLDARARVNEHWHADLAQARTRDGVLAPRDVRMQLPDGREHTLAVGGLVFGDQLMITFEDRTELLAQSERLHRMAYLDGLTGITNRRGFDEALRAAWERCASESRPLALLMIDIDEFKAYNDLYGHLKGDECLQAVATALRTDLARPQDLTARYGGEEFVCLLPDCSLAGATTIAERHADAVRQLALPHKASRADWRVTVSIGGASVRPGSDSACPDQLIARADAMLYRAKQAGRNRIEMSA